MKQVLSVTATFADGVARRVLLTTSKADAVRVWRHYRARSFPAKITTDEGKDVSPPN